MINYLFIKELESRSRSWGAGAGAGASERVLDSSGAGAGASALQQWLPSPVYELHFTNSIWYILELQNCT